MKLPTILYAAALPGAAALSQEWAGPCGWERLVVTLLLGVLLGVPLPGLPSWWKGRRGRDSGDGGPSE